MKRISSHVLAIAAVLLATGSQVRGDTVTVSHPAPTTIAGSNPPLIEMQSVTLNNNGSSISFTIQFFNAAVDGPSAGNNSSVYGFINLDTDQSQATGVPPSALVNPEGGFGQFTDSGLGTDVFISLSSEGDPLHGAPGLVDLVRTSDFTAIDTVPITYGSGPASLSVSFPVADFSGLPGFANLQAAHIVDFSAIVGNVNNATDVLSSVAGAAPSTPEPAALWLAGQAALLLFGPALLRARRAPAR